ncbi:4Fe-4S binding protein [Parabacteroides sp. Marseille-P3160]|uniref:4Fe-4S binding protein n=1 Tax=Parabacteroides sp. Marseille-P3160 TaxID=1917887 RepID=UPI0009BB4703|nr:4Fe-4S binding protein [Parabacteroides sp. Marseille-P3160]
MSSVGKYFTGIFKGIGSLLLGMSVTLKELFTKKVTQQYPENRATLVISDRFRGELVMPHDENNEHACTACGICEMNCPNGTITVKSKMIETPEGKRKKVLDEYFYDLGQCTFCNLCVISCPSHAILFSNHFENAVFTRSKLLERLNHEGSKLREKAPVKKPAPAVVPSDGGEKVKTEGEAKPQPKAEVNVPVKENKEEKEEKEQ